MNEEFISKTYELAKSKGYNGAIEDFKSKISSDNEFLSMSHKLVSSYGYGGSVEDFNKQLGIQDIKVDPDTPEASFMNGSIEQQEQPIEPLNQSGVKIKTPLFPTPLVLEGKPESTIGLDKLNIDDEELKSLANKDEKKISKPLEPSKENIEIFKASWNISKEKNKSYAKKLVENNASIINDSEESLVAQMEEKFGYLNSDERASLIQELKGVSFSSPFSSSKLFGSKLESGAFQRYFPQAFGNEFKEEYVLLDEESKKYGVALSQEQKDILKRAKLFSDYPEAKERASLSLLQEGSPETKLALLLSDYDNSSFKEFNSTSKEIIKDNPNLRSTISPFINEKKRQLISEIDNQLSEINIDEYTDKQTSDFITGEDQTRNILDVDKSSSLINSIYEKTLGDSYNPESDSDKLAMTEIKLYVQSQLRDKIKSKEVFNEASTYPEFKRIDDESKKAFEQGFLTYSTSLKEVNNRLADTEIKMQESFNESLDLKLNDLRLTAESIGSSIEKRYQSGEIDRVEYEKSIGELNKKFIEQQDSIVKSINDEFTSSFSSTRDSIMDEYSGKIESEMKKYSSTYKTPEELSSRMQSIVGVAAKNLNEKLLNAEDSRYGSTPLYNSLLLSANSFKGFVNSFGRQIQGFGLLSKNEDLYDIGGKLSDAWSVGVLEEYKGDSNLEYIKSVFNPKNVSNSFGNLLGSASVGIAASIPAAIVGGRTAAALAPARFKAPASVVGGLITGGLAGFSVETIDMMAQVRKEALESGLSSTEADNRADEMLKSQLGNVWMYSLDALPFVGKALSFIPNKALRVVVGANVEGVTETGQEIVQTAQEESIRTTGYASGWDRELRNSINTTGFFNNEMVKATIKEVYPGATLMGGLSSTASQIKESVSEGKMATEAFATMSMMSEEGSASILSQKILKSVQLNGKNFTKAWVSSLAGRKGVTSETVDKLLLEVDEASEFTSKNNNLSKSEQLVYRALQSQYRYYEDKISQLGSESSTEKEDLNNKRKAALKNVEAFVDNPKTNGEYAIVRVGKQDPVIMNYDQFVEYTSKDEVKAMIKDGDKKVISISFSKGMSDRQASEQLAARNKRNAEIKRYRSILDKAIEEEKAKAEADKNQMISDAADDAITPSMVNLAIIDIQDQIDELEREMNNAEYINDNKIDGVLDNILTKIEEVNKRSDISNKLKLNITNGLFEVAEKLDNYEFRAKSVSSRPINDAATEANEKTKGQGRSSSRTFEKTEVEINGVTGFVITSIGDGQVSVSRKGKKNYGKVTKLSFAENFLYEDENGNFSLLVMVDEEGNEVAIRDENVAIPLALAELERTAPEVTTEELIEEIQYVKEQTKKAESKPKAEEQSDSEAAEDVMEAEIDNLSDTQRKLFEDAESLGDNEFESYIFNSLEEVPAALRGKAKKREASEVEVKRLFGKTEKIKIRGEIYILTVSGKELRDLKSKEQSESTIVEETKEVDKLRAEEQSEMLKEIPSAKNALTDGKVDREKLPTNEDKAKFDEIYDKYDKLISPLLKVIDEQKVGLLPEQFSVLDDEESFDLLLNKKNRVQLDNARKAIKSAFPDLKIIVSESEESYAKVAGEKVGETSAGYYDRKGKIYINPVKVNDTTIGHEAFHAILLEGGMSDAEAKSITSKMLSAVNKVASPKIKKKIDDFSKNYGENLQSEEAIAELFGILADFYSETNSEGKSIIRRWLDRLAKALGIGKIFKNNLSILNESEKEIISFLNIVAKKVATGEQIVASDLDVISLENKSPREIVGSVRRQKGLITLSEDEVLKYARAGIENQYEAQAIKQIGLQGVKFNKEGIQGKVKEEFNKLIKESDNYILSEDSKAVDGAIQFEIDTLINDGASEAQIEQAKQAFKPGSLRNSFLNDYKETQKETLSQWKSYLSESDYNDSFKYLILDAVLTNNYDFKTNKYSKRTNKTLRNFTPFDAGTLAALYASNSKSLLKDYVEIQAKNSLNAIESSSFVSTKEGEWVKFEGGPSVSNEVRIENANKLSQIVQNTYWCTKTNAKNQLDGGDFYVYATKNKDGEYESRIAVRMEGDKVGEVRGNASSKQDLEPDMMPVADKFLKENIPNGSGKKWLDAIEYNGKVKNFTERISGKKINENSLKEYSDLIKDADKFRVDYGENGLVTKLKRVFENSEFDFPVARDLSELRPGVVLYIGDFIPTSEIRSDFFPKHIRGNAYFRNSKVTNLGDLQTISGDASFSNSKVTNLGNLQTIGGDAIFDESQITNLGDLQTIDRNAYFDKSQITNLGNLQTIGGNAFFDGSQVENLGDLQSIGGSAYFQYSKITNLGNLQTIGGDAFFSNSKVANLGNLQTIGGDAIFENSQITNLGNLQTIGKTADFSGSEVANLGDLQTIGKTADFQYSKVANLGNLQTIGLSAYFQYSKVANLGNLKKIGRKANFGNSQITNLGNLQTIGGDAFFSNSQITNLGNLQTIGESANFGNSQITNLGNLQSIGGTADFQYSKVANLGDLQTIGVSANFGDSQITNLGNLQTIGVSAFFFDSQVENLGNLQTIGGNAYFDDSNSKLKDEWERRQSATQTRQQRAKDLDLLQDQEQGSEGEVGVRRQLSDTASKASSVDMFENPSVLEPKRMSNGRTSVLELGKAFDKRAKENGTYIPLPKNGAYTDSQLDKIAEAMTDDAQLQLQQDDSGIGWYDLKTKSAMELMSRIHPELSDSNSEDYLKFTLMVALISQNNSVGINFRQANYAYTYYKNNNKLPDRKYAGKSGNIIKQNIALSFEAIKKKGWENYKNTLQETKTVKDWESEGYKISGENKTTEITGAMVMLGSKIGSFWGNLNGDFNTLTADLWFSRMFNRYTGNVVAKDKTEGSKKSTLEAIKSYRGSDLLYGFSKAELLKGGEKFDEWLNTIVENYSAGGYKNKIPLNVVSNTHFKNLAGSLQDIPRGGGERNAMRNVVKKVQAKLIERGYPKLDIADIQAIVWYNEKDLYRQYKAVNKSSEKTDYETAAQEVLREQGVNAEVALPFKTSKSSANGGRKQTDRIQPKSLSEKVVDAPQTRQQRAKVPTLKEVRDLKVKRNLSGSELREYLKSLGMSFDEISSLLKDYRDKYIKEDLVFTKDNGNKIINGIEKARRGFLSSKKFKPKSFQVLGESGAASLDYHAKETEMNGRKLLKAIEGNPASGKALEDIIKNIDLYLRGEAFDVNGDPLITDPKILDAVQNMRSHLDILSEKLIDSGLIKAEESVLNIIENLGSYLNRSFQVFDDKDWVKNNVTDSMILKAKLRLISDIRDLNNKSPYIKMLRSKIDNSLEVSAGSEYINRLEKVVNNEIDRLLSGKDDGPLFSFNKEGAVDTSVLMEKNKEIPKEILELLGEYVDPLLNYTRSAYKIVSILTEKEYLRNLVASGDGVWLFKEDDANRPAEFNEKIIKDGEKGRSELSGYLTTKEIAAEFNGSVIINSLKESASYAFSRAQSVYTGYLKAVGSVKYSKTILSIGTHAKNVIGNAYFMAQNGYLSPEAYNKAFSIIKESFSSKPTSMSDLYEDIVKSGLLDQGQMRELRSIFSDSNSFESAIAKLQKKRNNSMDRGIKKLANKGKTGLQKGASFAQRLYQAEDDFFKVVSFQIERERYAKALHKKEFKDLNQEQKEEVLGRITEIVKNILPNYSRLGDLAKLTRLLPVAATFISFELESYRTAWNTVALAIKEIKDPKTRSIGVKRLSALSVTNASKYAGISMFGSAIVAGLKGRDDDEESWLESSYKYARDYVYPWSKNSQIVILEVSDGKMAYLDLSASDPQGSMYELINSAMLSDSPSEALINSAEQLISPYLSSDILLSSLTEISKEAFNPDISFENKIEIVVDNLYKAFKPGTIASASKIMESETPGIEAFGQFTGYKPHVIDVDKSFSVYKIREINDRLSDNYKRYNSLTYKYKDGLITKEDLESSYQDASEMQQKILTEANGLYNSALKLTADESKMKEGISKAVRDKKLKNQIVSGDIKPMKRSSRDPKSSSNSSGSSLETKPLITKALESRPMETRPLKTMNK